MVKPLRSEDPTPQNMQFAHFGVLNDGSQSKASLFTSIPLNIIIAVIFIIISAAAKQIQKKDKIESISLAPIRKVEPEPIKPKIVPKLRPPLVVKAEPPKIKLPEVKLADPPKIPEFKLAQQAPIIQPAPPKIVTPPPPPNALTPPRAAPPSSLHNARPPPPV